MNLYKKFQQYMANLPIRVKLRLIIIGTCSAVTMLALGVFVSYEINLLREKVSSDAVIIQSLIGHKTAEILYHHDKPALQNLLDVTASNPNLTGIYVFDQSNDIIASAIQEPLLVDDLLSQYPANDRGHTYPAPNGFVFSQTLIWKEQPLGSILLAFSYTSIKQRLADHMAMALLILCGAAILAYFLSESFQRAVTAPLMRLARHMQQAGDEHNYQLRLPPSRQDDEVGVLINGFNKMLTQIQAQTLSLNEATEEQANLINSLRAAKEREAQATQMKSRFLANMSHEIRTPINGVVGMLDLLMEQPLEQHPRDIARIARQSGHSLLDIVNNFLDYSKLEAGKLSLHPTPTALLPLIDETSMLFAPAAAQKQLGFRLYIDPACALCHVVDATRLKQILINLLSNAIKFTEHGYVALSVTVNNDDGPTQTLYFSVKDSGKGVSERDQQRIFDAFTQSTPSDNDNLATGTGLGLTITKEFIEMMGSKLDLSSQLGEGTMFAFSLTLPIAENAQPLPDYSDKRCYISTQSSLIADNLTNKLKHVNLALTPLSAAKMPLENAYIFTDVADQAVLEQRHPTATIIAIGAIDAQANAGTHTIFSPFPLEQLIDIFEESKTIQHDTLPQTACWLGKAALLAEDNPVNSALTLNMLNSFGFTVSHANNGLDALHLFKAKPFDVVIIDGQMPKMDGMTALQHMRAHEADTSQSATPMIAATAHVEDSVTQAFLDSGASSILPKPFLKQDLYHCLTPLIPPTAQQASTMDYSFDQNKLKAIHELSDGADDAFLNQIITIFMNDTAIKIEELNQAAATNDYNTMKKLAHRMKSSAANIGAISLAEQARVIEQQPNSDAARKAVQQLMPTYKAVCQDLQKHSGVSAL